MQQIFRFYVRSVDTGNVSSEDYIDIQVKTNEHKIDILSVSEVCETNSEFTWRIAGINLECLVQ